MDSSLIACVMLCIFTVGARLRRGSWFAPSAFMGLVWCPLILCSLMVVDYGVAGRGMWMLAVLIGSIQLGALVIEEIAHGAKMEPGVPVPAWLLSRMRIGAFICTGLATLGALYLLISSLDTFDLPFTPLGLVEVGAHWTSLRYQDVSEPLASRLLVTWLHPAALFGGTLFADSRSMRSKFLGALTLFPSVLYSFVIAARAAVLLGLVCWLGGYLATLCNKTGGRGALFNKGRLRLLLAASACILMLFLGVDAVRGSTSSQGFSVDTRETRLQNYIFGSPAAFSDWFAHREKQDLKWGGLTLAGVYEILGIRSRTSGEYLNTSNVVGTEITNVYTIFRGWIEDFTLVGAVLLGFAFGLFSGYAFVTSSFQKVFLLSAVYAVTIFTPLQSLLNFNGVLLAWGSYWLVMKIKVPRGGFSHPASVMPSY